MSTGPAGAGDVPRADVTTVRVDTQAPYDVVVGHGLFGRLPDLVGSRAERVAIMHPPALRPAAERIRLELAGRGYQAGTIAVPDAEQQKTADVAAACWAELARLGLTRSDVVLGVGGGATTDLAGFVAATWLRGVRVVQVPTTLLGMVDAAVGGKTGINTDAGKNLVGVFHEPAGVLCDLDTLATLPRDDVIAGLAEVVKCGFVADPEILHLVEQRSADAMDVSSPVLRELVERAVRVKASVVAGDLRETDADSGSGLGREVLNYGHTFGHAIEQVERYTWRHGAAVAVGMVFVAELARLTGLLDPATAERHRAVLRLVGLPTAYRGAAWPALLDAMRRDKKARGDGLRFVALEGVASPVALIAPDPAHLTAAYAHVSAD